MLFIKWFPEAVAVQRYKELHSKRFGLWADCIAQTCSSRELQFRQQNRVLLANSGCKVRLHQMLQPLYIGFVTQHGKLLYWKSVDLERWLQSRVCLWL